MSPHLGSVRYTVVDVFTGRIFGGNPATVIILDEASYIQLTSDGNRTLQLIAREFNLSDTAFVTPKSNNGTPSHPSSESAPIFSLRWFTPKDEVALCGHATLASGHVLFSAPDFLPPDEPLILFETLSGILVAKRAEGGKIQVEFPAGIAKIVGSALEDKTKRVVKGALSGKEHNIVFVGVGEGVSFKKFMLIELEAPFDLEHAAINPGALLGLAPDYQVIMLTTASPSSSTHFVSRTFGPFFGVPEDPVTGSAHCMLGPYWHNKLHFQSNEVLHARQVSERGGALDVIWDQEKGTCRLIGEAKIAIKGELFLPGPDN